MADNQDNLNGKDLLIGTLVGAIIGASAALLLAPKAGRETRSDLNRQWVTVKDKTQEVSRTVRDKAKEVGQTVKDQSGEVIDKLRDSKNNLSSEVSNLTEAGKESALEVARAVGEAAQETVEQLDKEEQAQTD